MNHIDHSVGYKLLETAALVDFKVGDPIIQSSIDGEYISLQVDLQIGTDDEDEEYSTNAVEWAAFGLIFALGVLSFADARPRGHSDIDFVDDDEFTVGDLFECLRFVNGELHFESDYLRGRCMKTDITVRKDGRVTLSTRNRGQAALRWLDRLQGKKMMTLVQAD
jgi:hypothetical protein